MERGRINGVVFLDLKKAFDTVDHKILVGTLDKYGSRNTLLKWFRSYLSDRSQICKLGESLSTSLNITPGVPQGSNLGPLLFQLYINDFPSCLSNSQPAIFADGTNLTVSGETTAEIDENISMDLNKVYLWLLANKLTLNANKTEYMLLEQGKDFLRLSNNLI